MKHQKSVFRIILSAIAVTFGVICIVATLLMAFPFTGILRNEMAPFYKKIGSWDGDYVSLIQPYKAISSSEDPTSWRIDLHVGISETKGLYYFQITDVAKIAVENNIIMVYTPASRPLTSREKSIGLKVLHWFVIIPDQKLETSFETEDGLLAYIHTLGIEKPAWVEPGVAYQQFIKTRCLDWMPNCK